MSSDDALIDRVRSGDREALATLIEQKTPQLLAFIEKRMSGGLRRKVEPDDILQELTVSALNGLEGVDFGAQRPFSWLCQQAERRIIDAHRRHFGAQKRAADREIGIDRPIGGEGGGIADLLVASMTSPSSAFSRKQKEYHMLEALASLPEDAREALRLRYLEGLPSKEIAERLGKTDGATRVLLSRSLSKLQDVLSQNTDFQSLLVKRPDAPS
ncbi:ECF RNA polymerase sigma factor SigD [Maioricimonas rarisocia]|uniref:ECF RNA polymerase sigma factor SigD n=1 Tax=Maioricimonas rarisocia TaxID=2528026 RepID=A0A517ZE98_9PLAN|nr:sigma-70 family RNA polymerase sigma factor [Maioricimonas rarisocia]QDU40770.1 ECF RNA polymerase sigma factor SigD [Maioricimonas rarisocia]